MKLRKSLLTLGLTLGCLTAAAQGAGEAQDIEYVFNPHWYGQLQIGGQETLGETSFGKLLSFNAQAGVGYQFHQLWGVRFSVNAWQSKASIDVDKRYSWKWKYVAPMADITFNLSNLIGGYNPERLVDVNIFAGVGANVAFSNGQANDVNKILSDGSSVNSLRYIWDGTKVRFTSRFGAMVDFRVTNRLSFGLELQANTLPDQYNSKKAGNTDWYFNGYVGVKYCFGNTFTKRPKAKPEAEVIYQDRIVEKVVEKVVEVPVKEEVVAPVQEAKVEAPFVRNIFFTIPTYKIRPEEMDKVQEIANYMNRHPNSKVTITGYCDRGTGTPQFNLRLSLRRANAVKSALIDMGIPADRINAQGMDNMAQQPFDLPEQNRVAICVTE